MKGFINYLSICLWGTVVVLLLIMLIFGRFSTVGHELKNNCCVWEVIEVENGQLR